MHFTALLSTLAVIAPLTSAQLEVFTFNANNCPDGKHNTHNVVTNCNGWNGLCVGVPNSNSVKLYGGDSAWCQMYKEGSCAGNFQTVKIPGGKSNVCGPVSTGGAYKSMRCFTGHSC